MNIKTPAEIMALAEKAGAVKCDISERQPGRLAVLSILAGAYIALGGTFSVIAGWGLGDVSLAYPALQRLLSGLTFPLGLILVVVLGAELFTGNNAMLIPSYMRGHHGFGPVLKNWLFVWLGNFAGALAVVWLLVWLTDIFAAEQYRRAIVSVAEAKVSLPWLTVFFRGIGANWCVCLAIWLGMSGHNLLEKMAGCVVPVAAFVAIGYEHSIANMFYIPAGMFYGAEVGIWQMFSANLLPATLGNIVGGSLFVGCLFAWLHGRRD